MNYKHMLWLFLNGILVLTRTTNGTISDDYQSCGTEMFERLLHMRRTAPAQQNSPFLITFIDTEYKPEVIMYYTYDSVSLFQRINVKFLSWAKPMTSQWLEVKHIAKSQPEQRFPFWDAIIWGHEIIIIH